ncbi:probable pectinesterase/pectinesterase inhibitor 7 [Telopea speciosissima]|uniref:probable pectinesterase/pectinesterase inhibitor 7 n=1 Tax=Telopea speciosissima TaxID=54955 RepID=UPI001CC6004B|nr:probable pectinesterase/pectinesterase inhibitor 7 [Telopea speciosissima]
MASSFTPFIFLLVIFLSSQVSTSTTHDSICNSTQYPSYCKSVLPNNQSANIYDYGQFSVRRSLSEALKFQSLINRYLARKSSLSQAAISVLEDCSLLAELNVDFLTSSTKSVNTTTTTISTRQAEDVQALLSAVMTNQQTCLDELEVTSSAWNVKNGVYTSLSNGTKLYSVSLAIFTRGWVHQHQNKKTKPAGRKLLEVGPQAPLPFKLPRPNIGEAPTPSPIPSPTSSPTPSPTPSPTSSIEDEVVVRDTVVVAKDGSGNFTTIAEAIAAAPNKTDVSGGYFLVYVVAGVYEEYVSIGKNQRYIMMIGDGINQTIITGNRSVGDNYTTFNSATFAVVGEGFVGMNLTIRNTAGAIKHQAVALRNGADLSTFYLCSFEAYQDTLYTHSLRQFYRECDIYGTVDFIFGNAAVVFQYCNLYARLPMSGQFNALTAQGRTDPSQTTGTSIQGCNILAAADLSSSNSTTKTYLGRPWKEYSRTVYMQSYIDSLIDPSGWAEWNGSYALDTLYYAEYNNTGPGSDTTNRVTWAGYHVINATDAANFTVSNFIEGDYWLNNTGVPYTGGLL